MSSLLKLRDYQRACLDATWNHLAPGRHTRVANVLPTGAGKTVVFSHMAEEQLTSAPGKRVLVLAHTDELVEQAVRKMREVAPHRVVGVVKAGRNEVHAEVIVASVQTLRHAKRRAQIRNVGLIICDECHHSTARTYRTILEHFGAFGIDGPCWNHASCGGDHSPSVQVVGFTATLARADKGKLSDIWQEVAYRKDIAFMIRRGYLLDVKGHRVKVPDLDLTSVKVTGGDYQEGALADELERAMAPEIVAGKYAELASERKGLLFAPTVHSAELFAEAFNERGIPSEVVHGALPREERKLILKRLASGDTQVVANCMVLTEGFDDPSISCVVIARPTRSAPLYQQMVGRALRPDLTLPPERRGHALVLDVVGASADFTLCSLVDLSSRKAKPEDVEDLSLLEMEDYQEPEERTEQDAPVTPMWHGPVQVEDFDPLARASDRFWGRTPAGHYWMSAGGEHYVFLVPSLSGEAARFDVVWCTKRTPLQAGMTEHRNLDFEMALSWAEDYATELGGAGTLTLTRKKSAWRKQPPTEAQLRMARSAGIVVPVQEDGSAAWSKGEVSAAIDDRMAARVIDPLVRRVLG